MELEQCSFACGTKIEVKKEDDCKRPLFCTTAFYHKKWTKFRRLPAGKILNRQISSSCEERCNILLRTCIVGTAENGPFVISTPRRELRRAKSCLCAPALHGLRRVADTSDLLRSFQHTGDTASECRQMSWTNQ